MNTAGIEKYIEHALSMKVHAIPLPEARQLPYLLHDIYQFYQINIANQICVAMLDSGGENTPAAIRKHMDFVQKKLGVPGIYVCNAITAYNRERLIGHHVPFIVPGNQMYLPFLGVDLREYFLKQNMDGPKRLGPATQAVFVFLTTETASEFRLADLALGTGYTAMSISRAVDDLEAAGLIVSERNGRDRVVRIEMGRKDLVNKAMPLMQDPVKRRTFLRASDIGDIEKYMLAGEAALAHYTTINQPSHHIIAMSMEEWRGLHQQGVRLINGGDVEVEVWQNDPRLFGNNGVVNELMLYLSMKDQQDERLQIALEDLIEGYCNDTRARSVPKAFRRL